METKLYLLKKRKRVFLPHDVTSQSTCHRHHHLPPWIRSFHLFRHRSIAIVSWGVQISSSSTFVVEGVFRQSGVVHPLKVVDPVLFVFESHVLYSRGLYFFSYDFPVSVQNNKVFAVINCKRQMTKT